MKKEDAIAKINKLGRISNIIVRICKILLIIGFVLTLLATIVTAVLPKGFLSMEMGATADVKLDLNGLTQEFTEEEKQELITDFHEDFSEDNDFKMTMGVNGAQYEYDGLTVDMNNMVVSMRGEVERYTIELGDLFYVAITGFITMAALFVTLVFAGRLSRAFRDCQSPFEDGIIKSMNQLAFSLIPWVLMNSVTDSINESIFTNNKQIVLGVDLGVLIIIFFIFILAYIFKYGAVLQQESDETL